MNGLKNNQQKQHRHGTQINLKTSMERRSKALEIAFKPNYKSKRQKQTNKQNINIISLGIIAENVSQ